MNGQACTRISRTLIATLAPLLCGTVSAAAPPKVAQDPALELDEILVEGRTLKRVRKPQASIDWLARLIGRFVVDGSVDVQGNGSSGNPQPAQGRVDCTGMLGSREFSTRPVVRCELAIRWPEALGPDGEVLPGSASALNPASMLYAFEWRASSINYMMVDSNGIAQVARGYLFAGDTLVSRSKCVNVPGNCERVVQITAEPDLEQVEMKIDLEVESRKTASYRFVMHRVPGSPRPVVTSPANRLP